MNGEILAEVHIAIWLNKLSLSALSFKATQLLLFQGTLCSLFDGYVPSPVPLFRELWGHPWL